jgi:hypothetical protein
LFFSAQAPRDVAERNPGGIRGRRCGLGVLCDGRPDDAVLELWWAGRSCWLLAFARFELGAVLRGKNALALQVFGGVNAPVFFLLVLLACAFLTRGLCDAGVLVWRLALDLVLALLSFLSTAPLSAGKCERKNQDKGDTTAHRAGRGRCGAQVADPGWGVKIRTCHSKANR